jgi:hypothetical protein
MERNLLLNNFLKALNAFLDQTICVKYFDDIKMRYIFALPDKREKGA